MSPEDRVTKSMELQEDITKKSEFTKKLEQEKEDIFPKPGEKVILASDWSILLIIYLLLIGQYF